ncbi:hypothetical protein AC1031_003624 [Aphanomyces cochlioides]|nr:hypothetical protein AC1031_003624 [Aphanomyces cochlioides]
MHNMMQSCYYYHVDLYCHYAYSTCTNLRTRKKDGDLHTLCEFHRAKANSIQKVYATKRRRKLKQQEKERRLQHTAKMVYEAMKAEAKNVDTNDTCGDEDLLQFEPSQVDAPPLTLTQEDCALLLAIMG